MNQDDQTRLATWLDGVVHLGDTTRMAIVLVLLVVVAQGVAQVQTSEPEAVATVVRSVLVEETNEERVAQDKTMLRSNGRLQMAAQRKAEDMARGGYFAHVSPDGRTPWYWFELVGYEFTHAGENLAVRFSDSDALVRAWMASPGHRANILNPDFTETGIGMATGTYKGVETIFVVQLFGTPYQPAGTMPGYDAGVAPSVLPASVAQAEGGSVFIRVLASPETAIMGAFVLIGIGLIVLAVWGFRTNRAQWSAERVRTFGMLLLLCALCAYIVATIIFPEVLIL